MRPHVTEGMKSLLSTLSRRAGLSLDTPITSFHMSRSRRWRTRNIESRQQARALSNKTMAKQLDYKDWSQEKLIERVTELEKKLKAINHRFVR